MTATSAVVALPIATTGAPIFRAAPSGLIGA
jgi:hypothetical protein